MSLYQCDKCGCIENTALGMYWSRNSEFMRKSLGEDFGKALCSACAPPEAGDDGEFGKWHDKFEREFYPLGTMETCLDTDDVRKKKMREKEKIDS